MYPTTYGRSKLAFYDDLFATTLHRLVEVLADMACSPDGRAQTLMDEAFGRKCARWKSVFPKRPLPEPPKGFSCRMTVAEQIRLITTCWIDGIRSLADDNELDIALPDENGRVRPLTEIVVESILDDAVLAGRLIEISGTGPARDSANFQPVRKNTGYKPVPPAIQYR